VTRTALPDNIVHHLASIQNSHRIGAGVAIDLQPHYDVERLQLGYLGGHEFGVVNRAQKIAAGSGRQVVLIEKFSPAPTG
jgi:hypothetical protein